MYVIWWPQNNILMLCFLYCIIGLCSQEEERLVRDLFRGYNKLIRPVQNMTQKVEVAFGLAFIQLINVVSLQKQKMGLIFVASYTSEPKSPTKILGIWLQFAFGVSTTKLLHLMRRLVTWTLEGFICTSPSWLSVTSSSSQCCWTRMASQMIEFHQFRCHFAEPQKR